MLIKTRGQPVLHTEISPRHRDLMVLQLCFCCPLLPGQTIDKSVDCWSSPCRLSTPLPRINSLQKCWSLIVYPLRVNCWSAPLPRINNWWKCWLLILSMSIVDPSPESTIYKSVDCWSSPCGLLIGPPPQDNNWWKCWLLILSMSIVDLPPYQDQQSTKVLIVDYRLSTPPPYPTDFDFVIFNI